MVNVHRIATHRFGSRLPVTSCPGYRYRCRFCSSPRCGLPFTRLPALYPHVLVLLPYGLRTFAVVARYGYAVTVTRLRLRCLHTHVSAAALRSYTGCRSAVTLRSTLRLRWFPRCTRFGFWLVAVTFCPRLRWICTLYARLPLHFTVTARLPRFRLYAGSTHVRLPTQFALPFTVTVGLRCWILPRFAFGYTFCGYGCVTPLRIPATFVVTVPVPTTRWLRLRFYVGYAFTGYVCHAVTAAIYGLVRFTFHADLGWLVVLILPVDLFYVAFTRLPHRISHLYTVGLPLLVLFDFTGCCVGYHAHAFYATRTVYHARCWLRTFTFAYHTLHAVWLPRLRLILPRSVTGCYTVCGLPATHVLRLG